MPKKSAILVACCAFVGGIALLILAVNAFPQLTWPFLYLGRSPQQISQSVLEVSENMESLRMLNRKIQKPSGSVEVLRTFPGKEPADSTR